MASDDFAFLKQENPVAYVRGSAPLPSIRRTEILETRPIIQADFSSGNVWNDIADIAGSVSDELDREIVAADAKATAERETGIETRGIELRDQFREDPEGFDVSWEKYSADLLSKTEGRLHDEVSLKLQKERNQIYGPLLNRSREKARVLATDSLQSRQEILETKLLSLSATGNTESADYLETYDELSGNLRSQVNLGMRSPDGAVVALNRIDTKSKANIIVSQARNAYTKGDFDTVAKIHDDLISGEVASDMEPEDRRKIATQMMTDLTRGQRFIQDQEEAENTDARESIRLERAAISKDLYDQIHEGSVTSEWLEENRATLSVTDYKAGLRALRNPRTDTADPVARTSIDDAMDDDPDTAEDEAKAAYAAGSISTDDLQDVMYEAGSRKAKPVSEADRSRLRILDTVKIPKYLNAYVPNAPKMKSEAVKSFDQWLAANPDATDADIEKRSQEIITRYRVDAANVLPAPYGLDKKNINIQSVGKASARLGDDYEAGRISDTELLKQLDALEAWQSYLKESATDGK